MHVTLKTAHKKDVKVKDLLQKRSGILTKKIIAIVFIGIIGMGINDAVSYMMWNRTSDIGKK